MEKKCSKCKEIKSTENFGKDRSKSDGLTSACRKCNNIRNKRRRANGGDFTKEQRRLAFEKDGLICQICSNSDDLQIDHKLPQFLCKPNKASIEHNASVLCSGCNIAKGKRMLIEVIKTIPRETLGPMLSREYVNKVLQKRYRKERVKIGGKEFTEVKFI